MTGEEMGMGTTVREMRTPSSRMAAMKAGTRTCGVVGDTVVKLSGTVSSDLGYTVILSHVMEPLEIDLNMNLFS